MERPARASCTTRRRCSAGYGAWVFGIVNSFRQARVEHGTVVWPGNIDIAPETLYDRSEPLGFPADEPAAAPPAD